MSDAIQIPTYSFRWFAFTFTWYQSTSILLCFYQKQTYFFILCSVPMMTMLTMMHFTVSIMSFFSFCMHDQSVFVHSTVFCSSYFVFFYSTFCVLHYQVSGCVREWYCFHYFFLSIALMTVWEGECKRMYVCFVYVCVQCLMKNTLLPYILHKLSRCNTELSIYLIIITNWTFLISLYYNDSAFPN